MASMLKKMKALFRRDAPEEPPQSEPAPEADAHLPCGPSPAQAIFPLGMVTALDRARREAEAVERQARVNALMSAYGAVGSSPSPLGMPPFDPQDEMLSIHRMLGFPSKSGATMALTPNKQASTQAVSKAKTIGAAVAASGQSAEAAIADELEAYVRERVAEEVEKFKALQAEAGLKPVATGDLAEHLKKQQEAIDMMFTQATAYKGVGNMATVLPNGHTLNGKADAGAIKIIALALGLDDPSESAAFNKQNNERNGIQY